MANESTAFTKKRSVELTKQERKALKDYRKGFDSEVACAVSIGIDRNVLNRVMLAGSGSTETISKIKAALAQESESTAA